MARLNFNEFGVLRPGIHRVKWNEMVRLLGFNAHRNGLILNGLRPLLRRLKRFKEVDDIFIDGSFVTAKPAPGDIDGYIRAQLQDRVSGFLEKNRDKFKEKLKMDFYPALTDWTGMGSEEYFEDVFKATSDDPPRLKGYLVVGDWRKYV